MRLPSLARACIHHDLRLDLATLRAVWRPPEDWLDGDDVGRFERAVAHRLGARSCVAFPLARSALLHALEAAGLSPGDEVVLPPISIPGVVDAVEALGLRPVYADIDPDTLVFDPSSVAERLTPRTAAIVVTYLFGVTADPGELLRTCRSAGLFVIEDFSHNFGAAVGDRSVGTLGDVGIYSSSVTKTLDTYGGGLAVTDDEGLARRMRSARDGLRPARTGRLRRQVLLHLLWNLLSRPPLFDVVTLPLLRVLAAAAPGADVRGIVPRARRRSRRGLPPAARERFTALQARVGLELLVGLEDDERRRGRHAALLRSAFRHAGAAHPAGAPGSTEVHWQCPVYAEDVATARRLLARAGIDAGTTNLALLPAIADAGGAAAVPVAAWVHAHALYLPAHERLAPRHLRRVAAAVLALPDGVLSTTGPPRPGHVHRAAARSSPASSA